MEESSYYNEYGVCRQCRGTENRHKMDCSYQFECIPPSKPKFSLDKIVDKIKNKHAKEIAYKLFRKL